MSTLEIRELSTPQDLDHLTRVFDDIWHPDPTNRPASADMLRALSHAGNYVVGAYVDGALAGGSVGFFAAPLGESLHSHMTGVSRLGAGHQVSYALKLHQREWALARGITTITWTFDPLVARNAYFNVTKLGAQPTSYHRDFYGDIGDELGGADESDRVLMSWSLPDAPTSASRTDTASTDIAGSDITGSDIAGAGAAAPVGDAQVIELIDVSDLSHPTLTEARYTDADTLHIAVPRDIEGLRRTDPRTASRWRTVSREALSPLLSGPSGRPVAFRRSGCYVFGPKEADA